MTESQLREAIKIIDNKKPEYIVKQYLGLKFKDKCPHCGGELSARFVKEGGEASGQG